SDLRPACMTTSDHGLFTQLNLGRVINRKCFVMLPERSFIVHQSAKDESLRLFRCCPPDEIEVRNEGDGLSKNKFITCLRIWIFQKRLRITESLGIEFVARDVWHISLSVPHTDMRPISAGRIWLWQFYMRAERRWCTGFSLARCSFPVHPEAVLVIEAYEGKPGRATPPRQLQIHQTGHEALLPLE
ncbi:hypothetical protein DFH29DRAFT_816456, partial [Suillus ampliporus]